MSMSMSISLMLFVVIFLSVSFILEYWQNESNGFRGVFPVGVT